MESIQLGSRRVPGFGVGAPADPTREEDPNHPGISKAGYVVSAGIAALQAAVTQPGVTVAGLQAAGNAAVGAVGPAIDALSGSTPDTMKLTQQAWQLNGKLASQTDLDTAKAIVNQMIALYQQAAKLPAPGGSGLLDWLAANKVAVIAAGGSVVAVGVVLLAAAAAARRPAPQVGVR
jgi:hypothetical protein